MLNNIVLPTDALLCKDCNCTNDSHKVALNQLYDDLVAAITMASQNSIHTLGVSRGNEFNRPGWKEFASDLYDISRDAYFLWRDSGSPRQGMLFDMKNRTKPDLRVQCDLL